MRYHLLVVTCLCILIGSVAANLLHNGDFTSWDSPTRPTGWFVEDTTKAKIARNADTVRSEPYACRITRLVAGTGNNYGVRQFVPVTPRRVYTLSGWFLDNDVNARGGVVITWCRSDSSAIRSTSVSYTDSSIYTWQRLIKTDTAPDSAVYAKCMFRIYGFTGSPAGGVVYCDDAEFIEGAGGVTENEFWGDNNVTMNITTIQSQHGVRIELRTDRVLNCHLSVYNLTGEECVKVWGGRLSPGNNIFFWHGLDRKNKPLPDGVYFVGLNIATGENIVKKVVLVR